MPETLLLTVGNHAVEAGTNTKNIMGLQIRVTANHGGSEEVLRLYFYHSDVAQPKSLGWRAAHDGALVLFLQRRDFTKYLLTLNQAEAANALVQFDDDENITAFRVNTERFAPRSIEDSDFAESEERAARSE